MCFTRRSMRRSMFGIAAKTPRLHSICHIVPRNFRYTRGHGRTLPGRGNAEAAAGLPSRDALLAGSSAPAVVPCPAGLTISFCTWGYCNAFDTVSLFIVVKVCLDCRAHPCRSTLTPKVLDTRRCSMALRSGTRVLRAAAGKPYSVLSGEGGLRGLAQRVRERLASGKIVRPDVEDDVLRLPVEQSQYRSPAPG